MANTDMRSCTIIVPGLLTEFNEVDLVNMVGLKRLLSRSQFSRYDKHSLENGTINHIAEYLSCPHATVSPFPVAAYALRHYMDLQATEWCMHADPIHLRADRDQLLLLDTQNQLLSDVQAKRIVDDINQLYSDEPWCIALLRSDSWVIRSDQVYHVETCERESVTGSAISAFMPTGEHSVYWVKILNELQMFLSNHPVNDERQSDGLLPINSVWFWGQGVMANSVEAEQSTSRKIKGSDWRRVFTHSDTIKGMLRYASTEVTEVFDCFDDCASTFYEPGNYLIIPHQYELRRTDSQYESKLSALDKQWFQPALTLLQNGKINAIDVDLCNGLRYHCNSRRSKRWWYRNKPWSRFIICS